MPSVRISRSAGRASVPGELGQPPGGRAAEELELPEPVLAVAEAERERDVVRRAGAHVRNAEAVAQDVDGRLQPGSRSRPEVRGSGRLKSWYHRPAAPSAAPSVPPVAIRASGVPSIAADSLRSRARAGDASARQRLEAADAALPRRRRRAACQPFEGRLRDTRYANRSRRSLAARATRCGARAAAGPWAPA